MRRSACPNLARLLLLGELLGGLTSARAQTGDSDDTALTEDEALLLAEDDEYVYETVVPGYRLYATDEVTGFAETIEVVEETTRLTSVSEVLVESTGVQVRRTGGLGSRSEVSIRGSTSAQVPIFLDGIQLNVGGFSSVNLGDLPLDTLDSIEVYRGNAPVALGSAGIGGAVVLKTRCLSRPGTESALSYGSWHTGRGLLVRQDTMGDVSGLALFSAQGAKGDFTYLNRNGTLFNEADDQFVSRQNNQHVAYSGLVKLNGTVGSWEWVLLNELFAKDQGVAGTENIIASEASLFTLRDAAALQLNHSLTGRLDLNLIVNYLVQQQTFSDPKGEVGIGHQHIRSNANGAGAAAVFTATLSEAHQLTGRIAARFEHYREIDAFKEAATQVNPSWRLRSELGAEHRWTLFEPLAVVATIRGEYHLSRFGGGPIHGMLDKFDPATTHDFYLSPSLGFRLQPTAPLTIRGNIGRYFRPPDLSELFGNQGVVVGNPKLRAESGINGDLGLLVTLEGIGVLDLLRVGASWFGGWTDHLIAYTQNSQDSIRPENVDAALIQGVEAILSMTILDHLLAHGNYTFLYGVNRSDKPFHRDKRLPGRPAHEAYAKIAVTQPFERFEAGLFGDLDFAGNSFLDQANRREDVLSRLLLGLGGWFLWRQAGLTLTVEIKNLADTITLKDEHGRRRPIRDYQAFMLPGRTVLATLHWKSQ